MSGQQISERDLDALQAFHDAATPGGWERHGDGFELWVASTSHGLVATIERTDEEGGAHDADLIVAAVNALPALIACLRRARQEDAL